MLRRHARLYRWRAEVRTRRHPPEERFRGAQAARYELRPEDLLAADKAAASVTWT